MTSQSAWSQSTVLLPHCLATSHLPTASSLLPFHVFGTCSPTPHQPQICIKPHSQQCLAGSRKLTALPLGLTLLRALLVRSLPGRLRRVLQLPKLPLDVRPATALAQSPDKTKATKKTPQRKNPQKIAQESRGQNSRQRQSSF